MKTGLPATSAMVKRCPPYGYLRARGRLSARHWLARPDPAHHDRRLVNATGDCDAACQDQLRNTVTVHIRSRHVDNVTCAELGEFRELLSLPPHHRTPAYYHLKLAEASRWLWRNPDSSAVIPTQCHRIGGCTVLVEPHEATTAFCSSRVV